MKKEQIQSKWQQTFKNFLEEQQFQILMDFETEKVREFILSFRLSNGTLDKNTLNISFSTKYGNTAFVKKAQSDSVSWYWSESSRIFFSIGTYPKDKLQNIFKNFPFEQYVAELTSSDA